MEKIDKSRGFTIIELLISLVIGITLISLAFVSLRGFYNQQSVKNEEEVIVSTLRAAQEKSLSQENGSRWGVYFLNPLASGQNYYSLIEIDEDLIDDYQADSLVMPSSQVLEKRKLDNSLYFDDPGDDSGLVIIFDKITGKPSLGTDSVTIGLVSGGDARTVLISNSGRIDLLELVIPPPAQPF